MVMPGTGMILVEVLMQIPQRPVIGAVLSGTVEALLMCAPVGFVDLTMESIVGPMVALMLTVVVVVVRKRRRGRYRQGQRRRRE